MRASMPQARPWPTCLPPAPKTQLQSLSSTLSSQAANGTISDNGFSTFTLTGVSSSINVFNLAGYTFSNSSVNITAPAGSTVIVNVSGASDSFSGGSINLHGVTAGNVIFNFNSATSLVLSFIGFNGSILAPNAAFTGNSGQINGQLIATSAAGTTELHDILFSGQLPNSTPEPATWMMIFTGLGAIRFAKRRKAAGHSAGLSTATSLPAAAPRYSCI